MPISISSRIERELAVGLSTGEQKFKIMPIIIGSIKPCIKTATHITMMKILKSLINGQGMQNPQKSKYTMKQTNKAFLLL